MDLLIRPCSSEITDDDKSLVINSQLDYPCTSPSTIMKSIDSAFEPEKELLSKLPKLDEIFKIHHKIGEGTFSSVFLASLKLAETRKKKKFFAIKHLVPTCHPNRIERELRYLKNIGGSNNVIGLDFCLRINDNVAFIMPFIRHDKFNDYFLKMDYRETALYIKNLLIALKHVHSFNVIHRDIKPSNFLYDRKNRKFQLVDFGLAQDITKDVEKNITNKRKISDSEDHTISTKRIALQQKLKSPMKKVNPTRLNINKENHSDTMNRRILDKSPFKSPFKDANIISNSSSAMKKSPYKFFNEFSPNKNKIAQKSWNSTSIVRKLTFGDQDVEISKTKFIMPTDKSILQNRNRVFKAKKNFLGNQNVIKDVSITIENKMESKQKSGFKFCQCFKKPQVCNICMLKKNKYAQRAGTPGFRPPEVLLKYIQQTTAIDIWAVGIIFISILSGCYPFFKATDDVTALSEMITLFGTDEMKNVATILGQSLISSETKSAIDLKKLCIALRLRSTRTKPLISCNKCKINKTEPCFCFLNNSEIDSYPDSAYDLLKKLLSVNYLQRITAEEALIHPYLRDIE